MSAHNICFCGKIWKISILLDWKKKKKHQKTWCYVLTCLQAIWVYKAPILKSIHPFSKVIVFCMLGTPVKESYLQEKQYLTHLHWVDPSTTTLWTDLSPIAGCWTWPTFYDYIPVYKIWIQYTNLFKRYQTETIFNYFSTLIKGRNSKNNWWILP